MPCVLTSTAGYSKVLFSMENAQIMLEMAAKCSSYAKSSGLCFPFWIILFEADYAKNYASILYQCLSVAHLTNFSFEFFYKIFTEDASLLLLYDGAKKSKNDQKLKSRGVLP